MTAEKHLGWKLNQTMMRVRDPEVSIDFYTRILGMTMIRRIDFGEMRFSVYFLAYLRDGETIPETPDALARFVFDRETTLELTHNWGTENDESFAGYHDGNSEPRGFGHIGISVPDVVAACERLETLGVPFKKKPQEGQIRDIAFICDPDGYWIELLSSAGMTKFLG
jgi:lactoylglutathione lyase